MTPPAALLFDLDGTLVDSAVTIAMALSELSVARGGGPADVEMVRRLVSKGAPLLVREVLGPVAGDSDADLAAFRAILTDLPPQSDIVFPGVIDALETLSADGHPCAIVTNKPEKLARLLLDQLDLARYFAAVVGGDTLPVCKPDPAPLHHALQALPGADPSRAIMIGDSAVDATAAVVGRIRFFLFEGGYGPVDKDMSGVHRRFGEFAELPSLVHETFQLRTESRI